MRLHDTAVQAPTYTAHPTPIHTHTPFTRRAYGEIQPGIEGPSSLAQNSAAQLRMHLPFAGPRP